MSKALILATRGSALALAQSRWAAAALQAAHPGLVVELKIFKSSGDQKADVALSSAGGQGLFTKELEQALIAGDADLAVHSLKDLPTQLAPGLVLAAISEREDWRDAWLSRRYTSRWDLQQGATVGTGSPRRRAQLALRRPDLKFVEFRGNVDTRLAKLERGEVDGAVLACAGLRRLGLEAKITRAFTMEEMLPAPGQGFIALETRDSGDARSLVSALNHPFAFAHASAERSLLSRLEAGCHAPVGALAQSVDGILTLDAFVGLKQSLRLRAQGSLDDPAALGWKLAEEALGMDV